MSESIDFKRIADKAIAQYELENGPASFVEAVRLVWNARGAADVLAVEQSTEAGPDRKTSAVRSECWTVSDLGPTGRPAPCLIGRSQRRQGVGQRILA
jgi:hypothetical protein